MAKPSWVHVKGPGGKDTTVQLSAPWKAALKYKAGRGWHTDYTAVAVKSAAAWLTQPGRFDATRDGAFSAAVRRRAYEQAS